MFNLEYLADRTELVPELARLHFDEWGYLRPDETLPVRIEKLRAACGHNEIPTVAVATDGPELLGSAALVAHDMKTRTNLSPWLAGVYVKPRYRRNGIASKLVARIESEAVRLGVNTLYLFTTDKEGYYAKRGWSRLEHCNYCGSEVAVMSKLLEA